MDLNNNNKLHWVSKCSSNKDFRGNSCFLHHKISCGGQDSIPQTLTAYKLSR